MTYDPTRPAGSEWQQTPEQAQMAQPPAPYSAQPPAYGSQPAPYMQPGQPMQPGYQGQPVVAPKNPGIGLLLSFFIPGLGSMVNGNVGMGVAILCLFALGLVLSIFIIGVPIAFGVWIWGMVDGYQSAQKWNQAHGIIS